MKILTFKELDEIFLEIEQNVLLLGLLKPINLEEEKEKFFRSKYKYNPTFKYSTMQYPKYRKILGEIEISDDSKYTLLYQQKLTSLIQKLELVEAVGTNQDRFIELSQKLYPTEDNAELFDSALKIVNLESEKDGGEYLAFDEIYELVAERLNSLNLDTKIEVKDEESMRFHVDHHNNKIFIPRNVKRTKDSINGMLMHEINVHLLRAENGKKMDAGIFFLGTADYISDEEGLASLLGYIARENKILRRPAIQYIALREAINSDFQTSFNKIYSISRKPTTCWNLTLRTKRGLIDTSQPGAFTKDQYFRWSTSIGRKIISNPDIINYLFNGKASIGTLLQFSQPTETKLVNVEDIKNLFKLNFIL